MLAMGLIIYYARQGLPQFLVRDQPSGFALQSILVGKGFGLPGNERKQHATLSVMLHFGLWNYQQEYNTWKLPY